VQRNPDFGHPSLGKIGDLAVPIPNVAKLWRPILACSWNQRHASSVCHAANIVERAMPNGMLGCATCGRSLEETAAWKGNGERYYCNDFCAEAEAVESPSLIPSLTEDVSARIAALTSRARL
jgi:hypothetical protein